MSRRSFGEAVTVALLFASATACGAGGMGSASPGGAPSAASAPPRVGTADIERVRRAWPVMGTMLTVTVWGRDTAALLALVRDARDSVRLVDSLMSLYRPESELSEINRAAAGAPVRVSRQTMHVLLQARLYWRLSDGAFDPTVGPLVAAWGFHRDSGRVPPPAELDSLRALVGYGSVELDTSRQTVRLPRRGMRLDLGGIAKGYALDLARAAMRSPEIRGGSVDLGGNVLVFGRPPAGARWRIGIAHPRRDGRILAVAELDSGAVATSGDYERYFIIDGERYGHLIDPRTGRPARGVVAATAIGPRGEWSDGLSATLFLAGPQRGLPLADSLPGVAALYVLDPGADELSPTHILRSTRARAWVELDTSLTASGAAAPTR